MKRQSEKAIRLKEKTETQNDQRKLLRQGDVWPNGNRGRVVNVGQTLGIYKELATGDIEIELFAVPPDGKMVIRRLPTPAPRP